MTKANLDVREKARQRRVLHWRIADQLGMHDSNFARLLRKELPDKKKAEVFAIIEELARGE